MAAALLVVVALVLFVWGVVTGATALYWACVAVSAVAAVLLILARRRLGRPVAAAEVREQPRARDRYEETAEERDEPPLAPEPRQAAVTREVPAVQDLSAHELPSHELPQREPVSQEPFSHELPSHDLPAHQLPSHEGLPVHEAPVADGGIPLARHASRDEEPPPGASAGPGDPPVEEVEVTDLLLVVDLTDEVFVIDEHPRYHLEGCPHLAGAEPIPLPVDEARTDGFTPCGVCAPDRTLAERERGRRAGRRES